MLQAQTLKSFVFLLALSSFLIGCTDEVSFESIPTKTLNDTVPDDGFSADDGVIPVDDDTGSDGSADGTDGVADDGSTDDGSADGTDGIPGDGSSDGTDGVADDGSADGTDGVPGDGSSDGTDGVADDGGNDDGDQDPVYVDVNESFQQSGSGGVVDILVVMDNSDSMYIDHQRRSAWGKKQKRISDKFSNMLNILNGVDYQIGITTTDMNTARTEKAFWPGFIGKLDYISGTNTRILTPQTVDAQSKLEATLHRQESIDCRHWQPGQDVRCGSNTEEPLKSSVMAVYERDRVNQGLIRNGAHLAVLIVTDETESAYEGEKPTSAIDAMRALENTFPGRKDISYFGVIIQPGDKDCLKHHKWQEFLGQGAKYGEPIDEIAKRTGGSTQSICDDDYSPVVQDLRNKVGDSNPVSQEWTLKSEPLPGSVKVTLTPAANITWRVEGRKLIFSQKPPVGTKIDVEYRTRSN